MNTVTENIQLEFDMFAEAERLFSELEATSTSTIGITREAYGAGEQKAIEVFEAYALKYDLETSFDGAGNLVIVLPGIDRNAPCIACGSHLDSVPQGGNFDGAAGIVAGIISLARMRHESFAPACDLKVMAFRCEESAWFGKPYIGSCALLGKLSQDDLEARQRDGKETLAEAMERCGADLDRILAAESLVDPKSIAAYLEMHIEQGPVMIARDLPTAVVTGIRGAIRHRKITCLGRAGHSGAVPRWLRQDAFFATAELISALDEHWRVLLERGLDIVVTSGIVKTNAAVHAMTRIPDEITFSLEIRSQSTDALEAFYHLMETECNNIAKERKVSFQFDRKLYTAPARMNERWIERLKDISERLSMTSELIPSGAGHDAAVFANAGIPTAMIFIRNENGSHNPEESMEIEDFIKGTEILYHAFKEPL
ncbi:MAG: Zn-dependent hydrolase [Desulfobacterales bacterium]|nr:Zn-dependent hydrolase [Desulfobacterales bacterium]